MENMRFACDILKAWPTDDPLSTRWTNLPEHLFLGVGLIQKIGTVQRGRETRDPQIKIGQAHCQPRFLDGWTGDPSKQMVTDSIFSSKYSPGNGKHVFRLRHPQGLANK